MNALFTNKKHSMIPEELQPVADKIGISLTGIAAYLNIKLGFLGATWPGLIFTPTFNTILTIVISILSMFWLVMKIYDQYLVTRERKQNMKKWHK